MAIQKGAITTTREFRVWISWNDATGEVTRMELERLSGDKTLILTVSDKDKVREDVVESVKGEAKMSKRLPAKTYYLGPGKSKPQGWPPATFRKRLVTI
jgi:hypothetical protein